MPSDERASEFAFELLVPISEPTSLLFDRSYSLILLSVPALIKSSLLGSLRIAVTGEIWEINSESKTLAERSYLFMEPLSKPIKSSLIPTARQEGES